MYNGNIFIKNIYYMLSYAFKSLRQSNFAEIKSEEFDNVADLLAEILAIGVGQQIKQGLYREYIIADNDMPTLKGKLDINNTILNSIQRKKILSCSYDELSEDNLMNQIIKTTLLLMMKSNDVKKERRQKIKILLPYLDSVDTINPKSIDWKHLNFQRNNNCYRMMIYMCWFLINSMLLTTEAGRYKIASFVDDNSMPLLYERFVLEYYRYHHPELTPNPSYVEWNLNDGFKGKLPDMKTDITLTNHDKTLIIDTKYYSHAMVTSYYSDKQKLRSQHLYQIFAYVKNKDKESTGNVSGVLLYAKTDEDVSPNEEYLMSGNKISTCTLDLNTPFENIANQLENILISNLI